MRAVNGLLVVGAVLLLAARVPADPREDAEKALLGKWQTKKKIGDKEVVHDLDFAAGGKLKAKVHLAGADPFNFEGTYKVLDDKTIEVSVTIDGTTKTEKAKFKVDRDALEISFVEGKPEKYTRLK